MKGLIITFFWLSRKNEGVAKLHSIFLKIIKVQTRNFCKNIADRLPSIAFQLEKKIREIFFFRFFSAKLK